MEVRITWKVGKARNQIPVKLVAGKGPITDNRELNDAFTSCFAVLRTAPAKSSRSAPRIVRIVRLAGTEVPFVAQLY